MKSIAHIAMQLLLSATALSTAHAQGESLYQINGQDPEKYYSQFMFRTEGSCSKPPLYFHFLNPRTIKNKIGVNAQGQDVNVSLSIFMTNSSEWIAYYEEQDVIEYTQIGLIYGNTRPLIVRGRYHVDKDKLVLESLGEASAVKYNGQNAIELVFAEDLNSPGLKGTALTMGNSMSSFMPVPELDLCKSN